MGSRSVTPTPEGVAVAGLAAVLCGAGGWLGQHGVVVAGALVAGIVASGEVLAVLGLRRLSVVRSVPEDPVAGVAGWGVWQLASGRWPVPAFRVCERDGRAPAEVAALSAWERRAVPARWRWGRRGLHRLDAVAVESLGWFGVLRHRFEVRLDAAVVVGIVPRRGDIPEEASVDGHGRAADGVDPEFEAVRAWHPGEPWRRVHAGRSARAGRPLVVTRRAEGEAAVALRVRESDGTTFENDLSAAAFRIRSEPSTAFRVRRVGVEVAVDAHPAARRSALDALAQWKAL